MIKKVFLLFVCVMLVIVVTNTVEAAPTFEVKLVYTVQQGDVLVNLARKFGVNVEEIKKVNNLGKNDVIRVGDKLIIPEYYNNLSQSRKTSINKIYDAPNDFLEYELDCKENYEVKIEKKSNNKVNVSNLRTLTYYIKRGDNLYELAQEFNTNIAVIKKLNELDSSKIRLGDKIKLPINNLTDKQVLYHTISDKEFELLARLIHGEARGEPYIGQVAVGAVILNRVVGPYFPDNIRAVVYQAGQFSPVANGQINLKPNKTSYRAARAALRGNDPTRGAEYFYNPKTAKHQWWFKTREIVVKIGNHVFAK